MLKFDLHTHTHYSKDSRTHPRELVEAAIKEGLSGIAVTDHDTIRGGLEATKIAGDRLEIIVASEIKTHQGDLIGYFLHEEIARGDFFEVIDAIKDQDGIVCIPHPFDRVRFTSSLIPDDEKLKAVDRVEVLNARCFAGRYNAKAAQKADELGLGITAGSDAHMASEVGGAGVVLEDVEDLRTKKELPVFGGPSPLGRIVRGKFSRWI